MEELYDRVAGVITKHSGVPKDRIAPKSRLYADLRIDSLGFFALMMDMETTFDMALPKAEWAGVRTVSDIVSLVA